MPHRHLLPALLAVSLLAASPASAADPLLPAGTGGFAAVERALAKLERNCRVMVVGAHPDDEDTTLLTLASRGMGCEAAYLSLTRGDGGQNLIGPELGEALGVLRTEELLAARRIDGARQYFTRAYDFGYSKTMDEALTFWPREVLLADAVRVTRRFKPHVVVAVFPPTERAGHGQHQASGLIAGLLFEAAGESEGYPDLTAEGLDPWSPSLFYREAWWNPEEATLELEAGILDPLEGRSYFQLAMESRSQHRCQSFGMWQPAGPRPVRLTLEAAAPGSAGDGLFGSHDTRLRSVAELLPANGTRARLVALLSTVERMAAVARNGLAPSRLEEAVPNLIGIVRALRQARGVVAEEPVMGARQVDSLLAEKEEIAIEALVAALGVVVDATTEVAEVVGGEPLSVELVLWNAGSGVVELGPEPVVLASVAGWSPAQPVAFAEGTADGALAAGGILRQTVAVPVAASAMVGMPYFLAEARAGGLYSFGDLAPELIGEPLAPAPLSARFTATLRAREGGDAVTVEIDRPVVQRTRDLARGEVRQPLRLVPRVEVTVDPELVLWPLGGEEATALEVGLRNHGEGPIAGRVELTVPEGWRPPKIPIFELDEGRRETSLSIPLERPSTLTPGRYEVGVAAVAADGTRYELAVPVLDYEHIRPRPVPRAARVEVSALDLELPVLKRVGYVRGGGDRVPEALVAVGVPVEMLAAATLVEQDLSVFDAIVIGSRAYETSPELAGANPALLDYVRAGGSLIVQFQRWGYFEDGLPPFPMELTRRQRARTSDETAPVAVVVAGHPVLTTPNRLTAADWEGWVQERGTYYPVTWDEAYTAPLTMTDPGEEPAAGSLLVATYGEGTYVYTGIAFFRQLPAGVSGAFRLFANLLAL